MSQVPLFVHIKAPTPDGVEAAADRLLDLMAQVSPAVPAALGTPMELDYCGGRRCDICANVGSPVMLRWSSPDARKRDPALDYCGLFKTPDGYSEATDTWVCEDCMRGR